MLDQPTPETAEKILTLASVLKSGDIIRYNRLYNEYVAHGVSRPHKIYDMARADTKRKGKRSGNVVHAKETRNTQGSKPIVEQYHKKDINPVKGTLIVINTLNKLPEIKRNTIYGYYETLPRYQSDFAKENDIAEKALSKALISARAIAISTFFSPVKN